MAEMKGEEKEERKREVKGWSRHFSSKFTPMLALTGKPLGAGQETISHYD